MSPYDYPAPIDYNEVTLCDFFDYKRTPPTRYPSTSFIMLLIKLNQNVHAYSYMYILTGFALFGWDFSQPLVSHPPHPRRQRDLPNWWLGVEELYMFTQHYLSPSWPWERKHSQLHPCRAVRESGSVGSHDWVHLSNAEMEHWPACSV